MIIINFRYHVCEPLHLPKETQYHKNLVTLQQKHGLPRQHNLSKAIPNLHILHDDKVECFTFSITLSKMARACVLEVP
jgi:hypothetical protein